MDFLEQLTEYLGFPWISELHYHAISHEQAAGILELFCREQPPEGECLAAAEYVLQTRLPWQDGEAAVGALIGCLLGRAQRI